MCRPKAEQQRESAPDEARRALLRRTPCAGVPGTPVWSGPPHDGQFDGRPSQRRCETPCRRIRW